MNYFSTYFYAAYTWFIYGLQLISLPKWYLILLFHTDRLQSVASSERTTDERMQDDDTDDDEIDEDEFLTPEQLQKKNKFKDARKKHYNMKEEMMRAKQLLAKEMEELDDDWGDYDVIIALIMMNLLIALHVWVKTKWWLTENERDTMHALWTLVADPGIYENVDYFGMLDWFSDLFSSSFIICIIIMDEMINEIYAPVSKFA